MYEPSIKFPVENKAYIIFFHEHIKSTQKFACPTSTVNEDGQTNETSHFLSGSQPTLFLKNIRFP